MNMTELFKFLRTWILSVVPSGTELIMANQDGPAPKVKGAYLVLEVTGSWEQVGMTSHMVTDRPELAHPNVVTYRGSIQLREVYGLGDLLRSVVMNLDTQGARDYFGPSGVSILSTQGPLGVPALQGSQWRQEQVLTLNVLWSVADDMLPAGSTEGPYIQSVEITQRDQYNVAEGQEPSHAEGQKIFVQKPD